MSDTQNIYQDMSLGGEDSGSSDWSDSHFSDVESSGNEMEDGYSAQRYLQLNEVKYPEKRSTSPALPPQKRSTSPALPPRNNLKPSPIPPIRKKHSVHITREQNKSSSEANSRQFSKDHSKAPEQLTQALSKLRPVATSCKEDDEGNYIVPPPIPPSRKKQNLPKPKEQKKLSKEANGRKFPREPNKATENLSQALSKLRPVTPGKKDEEDYVLPVNCSRKHCKDNTKISENLALALSKRKQLVVGSDEEDGDYVVPINKLTWQQSKNSLISPMTHQEMSERKKLPIPPLFNTSNYNESSHQQDPQTFQWFHSKSSREVIKEQLLQHEMDGMFAVRKSNQKSSFHSYSLTFYHKGQIYNFPIRTRVSDKKFALGYEKPNEPAFSSLEKLVAYFKENKIKLANNELAILTKHLPKFS